VRQRGRRQEHPDRAGCFTTPGPCSRTSSPRSPANRGNTDPGRTTRFALLVDACRRAGAGHHIDVAYRYFSTDRRNFIVADTAATSSTRGTGDRGFDLGRRRALVTRRKRRAQQTRRHATSSPLGIPRRARREKDGPVDYSEKRFGRSRRSSAPSPAGRHNGHDVLPVSALKGDQPRRAQRAHTLVSRRDAGSVGSRQSRSTKAPAQPAVPAPGPMVNRPHQGFRGYAARSPAAPSGPATACACSPPEGNARRAYRHRRRRSREAVATQASRSRWRTRSTSRARRHFARTRRRVAAQFEPRSCGWASSRCSRAAPTR